MPIRSSRSTFLVLAAGVAAFATLQSLVSPVLSTIQHDLHTAQSQVTWVLTAWLLSAAVATPVLGRVGDMVGKRRTLVAALAAVAIGCAVAALAPNLGVLIVGRVIQGLGGALFPLTFGIIRDETPPARMPSAIGLVAAMIAGGGGLGIVLAGPIVAAGGWRWLFWLPMLVVAAVAVLAHLIVPESPVRPGGRVNWLATALLAGWLVALLVPVSEAPAWGWGSPPVIGLLVAAVVLFAWWILVETRSTNPLVDTRMMRLPGVWTTNLVALLFGAGMFGVYAFLPEFMQTPTVAGYGFGATVTRAGLLMLPMLVAMAVAGTLSGPLAPRFGPRAQLAWGSLLSTLAAASFAAYHDRPWQIGVAGAVFGLGMGMAYAAMASLIVQSVPARQTGVASGMNTNIRTIGGSLGTAIVSSIVTAAPQADGLPREAGFTHAFAVVAAISAAAVLVSLLVPSPRAARPTVDPAPERVPAEVG